MLLNTNDDADLLFGSNDYLAAFLGCTTKTIENYKTGRTKLPEAARRLLKLRYGDLTGLLGAEWQGFAFAQGELFAPDFKYGFKPEEVRAWFFGRQELAHLRREVKRLELELYRQKETAWAAVKVNSMLYRQRATPSNSTGGVLPRYPSTPQPCAHSANRPPPPPRRSGT